MIHGILERYSDNSRKDKLSVYKERKVEESVCVCVCMYLYIHMPASRHVDLMVVRVSQS